MRAAANPMQAAIFGQHRVVNVAKPLAVFEQSHREPAERPTVANDAEGHIEHFQARLGLDDIPRPGKAKSKPIRVGERRTRHRPERFDQWFPQFRR